MAASWFMLTKANEPPFQEANKNGKRIFHPGALRVNTAQACAAACFKGASS
jgi:hypothetical protein